MSINLPYKFTRKIRSTFYIESTSRKHHRKETDWLAKEDTYKFLKEIDCSNYEAVYLGKSKGLTNCVPMNTNDRKL